MKWCWWPVPDQPVRRCPRSRTSLAADWSKQRIQRESVASCASAVRSLLPRSLCPPWYCPIRRPYSRSTFSAAPYLSRVAPEGKRQCASRKRGLCIMRFCPKSCSPGCDGPHAYTPSSWLLAPPAGARRGFPASACLHWLRVVCSRCALRVLGTGESPRKSINPGEKCPVLHSEGVDILIFCVRRRLPK